MHKYFIEHHLKENNEFSIWIIDHIRIILITRHSSLRIHAHRPRDRCDLYSVRAWNIVPIALLHDLIVIVCVFWKFVPDIRVKLIKTVETSPPKASPAAGTYSLRCTIFPSATITESRYPRFWCAFWWTDPLHIIFTWSCFPKLMIFSHTVYNSTILEILFFLVILKFLRLFL